MIKKLLGTLAAGLLVSSVAHATLVATLSGQYNGDTPNIYIHNTTGFDFTNATLTGYAYNGSNALLGAGTQVDMPTGAGGVYTRTQVRTLGTIGAASNYTFTFSENGQVCGPNAFTGNYFVGDYDDSYGCSAADAPGNVLFTFSATWNGQSIFAQFSPDVNATGGFLGFLGLDQHGFAESSYDNGGAASGTGEFGVLANIYVGDPPPPSGVPEPMTLAILGVGLLGLGAVRRKA